ncbi:MAG: rhodanese-like domain-containing protein [Streptosporangiales bacterium]|nr:rhodanese-like domain-containing protein [Streptosporangiales bacterium]
MNETGVPAVEAKAVPEDAYLLDVREDDEWQAGRAPHATHIPMSALAERAGEVPQDRDVYVICRSGGRSARAVTALNQAGWKATNVTGGMRAWAFAGRPMVADEGSDPSVI